jgi:hypothetical protein
MKEANKITKDGIMANKAYLADVESYAIVDEEAAKAKGFIIDDITKNIVNRREILMGIAEDIKDLEIQYNNTTDEAAKEEIAKNIEKKEKEYEETEQAADRHDETQNEKDSIK